MTDKHTETHACDCVDRQAAIDALERIFDRCEEIEANLPEGDPDRTGYKMFPDYMTVWKYLHQLPSVQPAITVEDVRELTEEEIKNIKQKMADSPLVFIPSAQPEIIRCKDCKYYRQEIDMCDEPYSTAHNIVREDDFCSRAERRTT